MAANDPACLLAPIRALTGDAPVVAVQRIFADGSKRTLGRLTPFPGCCYVIGELRDGVTMIGCEGVATGEAIAQACPTAAVVVTIGVSREREVMGEIRALYPASPRVTVADRGRRVADAARDRPAGHIETITARAAQETRSAWVSMPAEAPEGYDAWDFATERGHDALAVWMAGQGRHEYEPRYRVLSGAAITSQPIIDDLVDDVIPAHAVGAVWGASAAAKSFLVLDLAAALTECRSFFGHDVFEPVPVLLVSLEGNNGLPRRYLAWEKHNGRPVPARLHTLTQGFSLLDPRDTDDLCEAIETCGITGGVVFIDPFALATIGLEENSSADMGRAGAALNTLRERTGCTVIAVHHTGKKQENGMRGSSNLPFLLDFHLEVTRDRQSGLREWSTGKQKDAGDDLRHAFRLAPVVIGVKRNGKPLTSCVIEDCDAEMRGREDVQKPEQPRGELQRIAFDVIGEQLRRGENIGAGSGCPAGRPCIAFAQAVELLAVRLVSYEAGKRRWKASKVIEAMQPKFYATDGEWLWRV
ncbi:AAA family ATPase [Paraburkholderia phymatum]|uniref:AAA family ATPase n=1 Tax=Paraburkholderia phymatum TaxID=148447 RepID=UPI0012FDFB57|nr:AAA family ATPase [Paraburkholderia phymatum]